MMTTFHIRLYYFGWYHTAILRRRDMKVWWATYVPQAQLADRLRQAREYAARITADGECNSCLVVVGETE
jgi:hypothetical protein